MEQPLTEAEYESHFPTASGQGLHFAGNAHGLEFLLANAKACDFTDNELEKCTRMMTRRRQTSSAASLEF